MHTLTGLVVLGSMIVACIAAGWRCGARRRHNHRNLRELQIHSRRAGSTSPPAYPFEPRF